MKKYIIGGIIIIIIIVGIMMLPKNNGSNNAPTTAAVDTSVVSKLDDFAKCIASSGAKFFGAYWCAHCKSQKELFGSSAQYLPYTECSTADGKGQTQVCADAKIEGYPTWVFADGTSQSGEIQLDVLAQKTGCTLPQ